MADAFREMLTDNRQEQKPTRAAVYKGNVRVRQLAFETLLAYMNWRKQGRAVAQQILQRGDFLLWVAGNHLGVLPVYEEFSVLGPDTLILQFDAHLDIQDFSDCTDELSHGNFLLHAALPLAPIINIGCRDLLMLPEYVRKHYRQTFSAESLVVDESAVVHAVRAAADRAKRIFIDIDCDALDPADFPAVTNPVPFGISSQALLRFLNAVWSERVAGVAISEFDPGRDRDDRCLHLLAWLLEYLLLKHYEPPS